MHWRWPILTNAIYRASGGHRSGKELFTSGYPAVLPGSPQTSYISVVRDHADRPAEAHPDSIASLVADHELMAGQHPIAYWKSFSSGIRQRDGSYMDSTYPQLTKRGPGDWGSIWFSPVTGTHH